MLLHLQRRFHQQMEHKLQHFLHQLQMHIPLVPLTGHQKQFLGCQLNILPELNQWLRHLQWSIHLQINDLLWCSPLSAHCHHNLGSQLSCHLDRRYLLQIQLQRLRRSSLQKRLHRSCLAYRQHRHPKSCLRYLHRLLMMLQALKEALNLHR